MIQVITTIAVRPGCMDDFLILLKENIPTVKAETGCLGYEPMADFDSGLPIQDKVRQNTLTLVETWTNLDNLRAHLQAPHMAAFRETARDYVQDVSYQILQPA